MQRFDEAKRQVRAQARRLKRYLRKIVWWLRTNERWSKALLAIVVAVFIALLSHAHDTTQFFLSWPPFGLVLLSAAVGALIGFLLHLPFDWIFGKFEPVQRSDIAGHVLGVVGVIYAVVLAFVVITAWQQYDHTEEVSMQEQHDVSNLFNVLAAKGVGSNESRTLRGLLRDYASSMQGEWQEMLRGEPICQFTNFQNEIWSQCKPLLGKLPASRVSNDLVVQIRRNIMSFASKQGVDEALSERSIELFTDFSDAREHRRHHYVKAPLQYILWVAFLLGGLITVGVTYLAEQKSAHQRMRAMALCAMIGIMLALALVFDHPFEGDGAIKGDQWCTLVERFDLEINPGVAERGKCSPA